MRVEVKICGLTRPADAAVAVEHGAWRLGVIFAGGPRMIDIAQAKAIVAAASRVPVLGVFGTQSVRTILQTVNDAKLSGAQLHGDYSSEDVAHLISHGLEIWRVVPVDDSTNLKEVLTEAARGASAVLVEPRHADGRGGKGVPLPLKLARDARRAAPGVRFVLAGGLAPESVAEAMRLVRPDAVDVSSGVETSPGIKDPARLIRFLENVRAARAAL